MENLAEEHIPPYGLSNDETVFIFRLERSDYRNGNNIKNTAIVHYGPKYL